MKPGRDAVDPHVALRVVERHLPGERVHRALRRAVRRVGREPDRRGDRADVDHRAAAARDHLRDRVARAGEEAPEVRVEHAVVLLALGLDDRLQQPDARVVAEDVDAAVALDRLGDEPLGVALVADVAGDERELESLGRERLRERLALLGVPLRPDDRGAFRGQPHGDRAPDAAARSRHDRDLAFEASGGRFRHL